MTPGKKLLKNRMSGTTLTELIIGMTVLALVILSAAKFFQIIGFSQFQGKYKALAGQISQEKIDSLRSMTFALVPVSKPADLTAIPDLPPDPNNFFDPVNFPMETRSVGAQVFKYYAQVQKVKPLGGNSFTVVAPDAAETSLRQVLQTVVWEVGSSFSHLRFTTVFSDETFSPPLYELKGVVASTGGIPLGGAFVYANTGSGVGSSPTDYVTQCNALGQYSFRVPEGKYNLTAKRPTYNYFLPIIADVNEALSPVTKNISLTGYSACATYGCTWFAQPVISRVVGNFPHPTTTFPQEWIQIFVPNDVAIPEQRFKLKFQRSADPVPLEVELDYSPGGAAQNYGNSQCVIFANTSPVRVGASNFTPSAVWKTGGANAVNFPYFNVNNNIIPIDIDGMGEGAGGFQLYDASGTFSDSIGWENASGSAPANLFETTPALHAAGTALKSGWELRRYTLPGQWAIGDSPAYDFGDNSKDWAYYGSVASNLTGGRTLKSGAPWPGNDIRNGAVGTTEKDPGFSTSSVMAVGGSSAVFVLNNVDTFVGLSISSHSYTRPAVTTNFFLSGSMNGPLHLVLTGTVSQQARIRVVDSGGLPRSEKFMIKDTNPLRKSFNPDTRVYCCVTSGVPFLVNKDRDNIDFPIARYSVTFATTTPPVYDFPLYPANHATGNVKTGGNTPLVNYSLYVEYLDMAYSETVKTDGSGNFDITLPQGHFQITPVIGTGEYASPPVYGPFYFSGGGTTQSGIQFTIFPGFAKVKGRLLTAGQPLPGNTLVALSTGTLVGYPALNHTSRLTGLPFYTGAVQQNGTFVITAPVGKTFNIFGWRTTESGGLWTTDQQSLGTVAVPAGPNDVDVGDIPWP